MSRRDCARFEKAGCAGVDLLAYRATEAEPIELVRAARKAMKGSCSSPAASTGRARARACATPAPMRSRSARPRSIGSFAPGKGSLRSQLEAILDACS